MLLRAMQCLYPSSTDEYWFVCAQNFMGATGRLVVRRRRCGVVTYPTRLTYTTVPAAAAGAPAGVFLRHDANRTAARLVSSKVCCNSESLGRYGIAPRGWQVMTDYSLSCMVGSSPWQAISSMVCFSSASYGTSWTQLSGFSDSDIDSR